MNKHGEKGCVVLGGGGHAKVLIDLLHLQEGIYPVAVLDPVIGLWGSTIYGVPVEGDDSQLPVLKERGLNHFVVGLGSIKDNSSRARIYNQALGMGFKPWSAIHPSAVISPFADLGPGCQVMAGSILNPDSRLAENVIVNTRAVVEHDCQVEAHAHLAPGSILGGGVKVGAGALIGTGAVLRQGVNVGERAVVAAGAVVIADVPDDVMVAGVPARKQNVSIPALQHEKV